MCGWMWDLAVWSCCNESERVCQCGDKACLGLRMWQRFKASLTVRARFFCSWTAIYILPSVIQASCCCAATRAPGAMAWTPKRSDPKALGRPYHLLNPASDTADPGASSSLLSLPHDLVLWFLRRCQKSPLRVKQALCVLAFHIRKHGAGPGDLRMWKNIAGGVYCVCLPQTDGTCLETGRGNSPIMWVGRLFKFQ